MFEHVNKHIYYSNGIKALFGSLEGNGMKWNGMYLMNRKEWNGIEQNGIEQNGMELNNLIWMF